ncbi:hypothetical protein XF36_28350 (plasmid) [Pseudonocardia sp. HH130629-09]|nr:hypothetical protein [Pseudonocardia sp. HH130629-09]ALE86559.1 hypothetical protein XF36_28350 [Pseudonocardia sp. HH130629-09]
MLDELLRQLVVELDGAGEVPGVDGDVSGPVYEELADRDPPGGVVDVAGGVSSGERASLTLCAAPDLPEGSRGAFASGCRGTLLKQLDGHPMTGHDMFDKVEHGPRLARSRTRPLRSGDRRQTVVEEFHRRVEQRQSVHASQATR